MREWREDLYARLRGHLCRVAGFDFEAAAATDATEVEDIYGASGADAPPDAAAAATPAAATAAAGAGLGSVVVAFASKRQYGRA